MCDRQTCTATSCFAVPSLQLQGNALSGRLDRARQPPTGYCGDCLLERLHLSCFIMETEEPQIELWLWQNHDWLVFWPPRRGDETKKTGREKQRGCLGKRGGEKMEREGQQERSQNIEENIPEAKNSSLRHSQIQSLGLNRVDSGTEEQRKPWPIMYIFWKVFVGRKKGN